MLEKVRHWGGLVRKKCSLNTYIVKSITGKYVTLWIENVHFRIPEEEWYIYPTWLVRYIQAIIVPVIVLSAISTKILMKKEIKQYLCGNSIYPVHN